MRASSLIYPFLIAFGLIQAATAQETGTLYPLPPQAEDTAWPTQDWPVRNILTDTQRNDLHAILDPIFATEIGEGLGETRAVLVIRNGAIIHERYRDGIMTDTRHVSWSVAKSITSALVGRAVQTGMIASIDDPMPGPFAADDPRIAISWRHWLQMLDGLNYVELEATGLDDSDMIKMNYGTGRFDSMAYARQHIPLSHTPGEHWNYSTVGFHIIGRALQSLLPGTCIEADADPRQCHADPQIMSDWIDQVLFDPLGIDGVEEYDAAGTLQGGSQFYLTVRDYAKFGLLHLRDGLWDGERLLPEGWVDFVRQNPGTSDNNGYGAGFWHSVENPDNPESEFVPPYDAFHAGGREGQLIWSVPSRDLIVVRVGNMPGTSEDRNSQLKKATEVGAAATP